MNSGYLSLLGEFRYIYPCGLCSVIFRIVDDVVILLSLIYCVIFRSSFHCYSLSEGFLARGNLLLPLFFDLRFEVFALDSSCFALATESSRFSSGPEA